MCPERYYHVAQASAITGSGIADPDERITADTKLVTHEMALVLCQGMYTATAGVFFAYKLGRLYGVRYTVAPYLYLWATFVITQKLAPVNFGKTLGALKELYSKYREAVARLMANQEAIAALKGAEVESSIIARRFAVLMKATEKYNVQMVWHNFVNQLGFQWWLRTFVGLFVIGPHVLYPAITDLSTIENIAKLRGNIGHEFVLFVQSMIAAGLTAKMGKQVVKLAGSAGRVSELLTTLKRMKAERQAQPRSSATTAEFIDFKDVKVQTPTQVTLIERLNFRLDRGDSLLITGHNGAGKSSIFRCLGGLWRIPSGHITKPGSAASGLHQDTFYLPQKPYNVCGTLFDQLTYPESSVGSARLSVEALTAILERVDLAYLAAIPGVLESPVDWEDRSGPLPLDALPLWPPLRCPA